MTRTIKIYGFINGPRPGTDGAFDTIAITDDGRICAQHVTFRQDYAAADLGMDGQSDFHHDDYQHECPHGYETEFVPPDKVDQHAGLQEALRRYEKRIEETNR